jgi:hypothetical protein
MALLRWSVTDDGILMETQNLTGIVLSLTLQELIFLANPGWFAPFLHKIAANDGKRKFSPG